MKFCIKCKKNKEEIEFYKRKNRPGTYYTYCKICTNKAALDRQHNLKQLAVEYKGGQCEFCGYKKYIGALEFHHKDQKEKDFHLGQKTKSNFNDEIKKELDKCLILCANCHREEHARIRGAVV